VLSQWVDGVLDARGNTAVGGHVEACAPCRRKAQELRAVGAWIATAGEPGPSCLSVDDMAAVLESGRIPAHVRTCPRCATEFRALKPDRATRRETRRRQKAPTPLRAWVAAAAVFVAVGILLVLASRQGATPKVEFAYRPPTPVNKEPSTPVPPFVPFTPRTPVPPGPLVVPDRVPAPPPQNPAPVPEQAPGPTVETPAKSEPAPSSDKEPVRETTTAPAPRVVAALNLKSGSLSALTTDGKWAKPSRIEEGMTLRADGRTQVEFAQARVTLDSAARFSVNKDEFALLEGGLSADVAPGGHFILVLDEQRFFPQTQNARVLLCAKPDRLILEEGNAKSKDSMLHEGTEYSVKKGQIEAKKGRSLPAAARAREQLTWRMDLSNSNLVKKNVIGRVDKDGSERTLVSVPMNDGGFYATAVYNNGGEAQPVFTVKENTAIRFRYYLREPGHLELVMWNGTKGENFNKPLEPVVRQWTTVTVYARDVAANKGGKPVTCEVGDKYTSVGFFVGKAGMPSELYIDRLEILEIDR